jgi:hypothetical protein
MSPCLLHDWMQALRQQARVAGQQAAGLSLGGGGSTGARGSAGGAAPGPTPDQVAAGARLLEQALEMCGAYGVPQAQVRLTAVVVALQSAPGISPEVSSPAPSCTCNKQTCSISAVPGCCSKALCVLIGMHDLCLHLLSMFHLSLLPSSPS